MAAPSVLVSKMCAMISTFMRADGGGVVVVVDDDVGATDVVSCGAVSVDARPVVGRVSAAVVGAGVVIVAVGDVGAADVVSTTTGVDVTDADEAASVDEITTGEGDGASTATTSRRCRVMGGAAATTGASTFAAPHCSFCSILRRSCA